MSRKILFLSAIDFKDKSIQVIKKTPAAYASRGWDVDYIVARDTSRKGNYYYEDIVKISNVNVQRFNWPFKNIRASESRIISLFFSKIASLLVILRIFTLGFKACKNKDYDYIYGYEMQGVLASNLLKLFFRNKKYIARFQGVYYIKEHLRNKKYINLLFNFDVLLALWLPSDLLIMTDDGTQGDQVLKKIRSRSLSNYLFISNGVEKINLDCVGGLDTVLFEDFSWKKYFIMVSRLVKTKRVHFMIEAFSNFIKSNQVNFQYGFLIVGDGPELQDLIKMTKKFGIEKYFHFVGAVENNKVYNLIYNAEAIFSLYESSNIGNPFFESMQCGTPMIAINNGDTSKFLTHEYNGLLINESNIVDDICSILKKIESNDLDLKKMSLNAKNFSDNYILSWEDRLKREIEYVESL